MALTEAEELELLELEEEEAALASPSEPPAYQPTMLESAADTINAGMSKIAPAFQMAGKVAPAVMMLANPLEGATALAAKGVNEGLLNLSDQAGSAVAEQAGKAFPNHPYAAGAAGMATSLASNPINYIPLGGLKHNFSLPPAVGKPSLTAQMKKMATGVEASSFDRLRRDPGALFSGKSRAQAGKAIGQAKANAGVNLGVTGDIKSLSVDNLKKARNTIGASNKAQDAIAQDLEAASELIGPNASTAEIIGLAKISPDKASTALEGINLRLDKLERTVGKGSKEFQRWTAIKSHIQSVLDTVAPDLKAANKDFARVALGDEFKQPFPVNQSGTMSKINAFGFGPAAAGVGAVLGGPLGAGLGLVAQAAIRSPIVAGLQTAARGYLDKAVDPVLRGITQGATQRAIMAEYISRITTKENQ